MKNVIKISAFFVISLVINSLSLDAMERNELIWVKTSDGLMVAKPKDSFSHMNFIQKNINKGKGFSHDDPIMIPITCRNLLVIMYHAEEPRPTLVGLPEGELQRLQRLARILEDYELLSRVNDILIIRSGGEKA